MTHSFSNSHQCNYKLTHKMYLDFTLFAATISSGKQPKQPRFTFQRRACTTSLLRKTVCPTQMQIARLSENTPGSKTTVPSLSEHRTDQEGNPTKDILLRCFFHSTHQIALFLWKECLEKAFRKVPGIYKCIYRWK